MTANGKLMSRLLIPIKTTWARYLAAGFALWLAPSVAQAIAASGGSVTNNYEDFRCHVFTNTGTSTFTVDPGGSVEILIVGGGGGGGGDGGGGGGAGGLVYIAATNLTSGPYAVTVGAGGAAGPSSFGYGGDGSNSVFGPHVAYGGGGGSGRENAGRAGASGGGGGASASQRLGGQATPAGQGFAGGTNPGIGNPWPAAGGGGAGSAGSNSVSGGVAGRGGKGLYFAQFGAVNYGSPAGWFAGGGGGSSYFATTAYGAGGTGGGGAGGSTGTAGTDRTGGGGGASIANRAGSRGGSGIVIVRYSLESVIAAMSLPASSLGATNATFNGKLVADLGDEDTLIAFCWGPSDAGTASTSAWPYAVSLGGGWKTDDTFAYIANNLESGSSYVYRVYATNSAGNGWSGTQTFQTHTMPSVTAAAATRIRRLSARLHGEVTEPGHPTLNPACGFQIWPYGSAVTSTVPLGVQGGAFSSEVDGLAPASRYQYMAFASNGAGVAWSSVMNFETLPAGPLHLYVATNGNNRMGTNWTSALTQPQAALDVAEPGDVICLAGHTFALEAPLAWPIVEGVTFAGGYAATNAADSPGPFDPLRWPSVITRQPSANIRLLSISAATNPVIERLTFRGGLTSTNTGGGLFVSNVVNFILRDSRILDNTLNRGGAVYGGGLYAINSSGLISNTCFRGNLIASGTDWAMGAGLHVASGAVTLRDVEVVGNRQTGSGTRGVGVSISGGTHLLRNVLVALNSHGGSSPFLEGGGLYVASNATVTLENLTVAGHGLQGLYSASSNVTVRNSIFHQNMLGALGGTTPALANNSLDADPMFEFPLFYLRADSPCLHAGDRTVEDAGLAGMTSLTNGVADSGTVNLGYHLAEGLDFDMEIFAAPDGDDGNDGSGPGPEQAVRSITRALRLSAGARLARINVAAGRYPHGVETFPLTIDDRVVQIIGTQALTTVIDAAGANKRVVSLLNSLGDNRMEGLTIRGGNEPSDFGGGLRVENSALVLRDCRVVENRAYRDVNCQGGGLFAARSMGLIEESLFSANRSATDALNAAQGGGFYLDGGYWKIRHTILAGNIASGGGGGGGGAYVNGGTHEFRNILAANNAAWGTWAAAHVFEGGGLCISAGTRVQMDNATFAGNTPPAVRNFAAAGDFAIRNSIFHNNTRDFEGTTPSLTNNCIEDGTSAGTNGNFSADPRLEFPLFYLMSGSLCLDAGDRTAEDAGLSNRTTRTDGTPDSGANDLGYHYAGGLGIDMELYVSPSGNDDNDGSGPGPGQTVRSITRALSLSEGAPRTRIHVTAGTYDQTVETFPLMVSGRVVQVAGTNAALTVINASGASRRVFTVLGSFGDTRLEGLTIRGGSVNPGDGGGLYVSNSLLTLRDCIVRDNTAWRLANGGGGGVLGVHSAGLIQNCVFTGNSAGSAVTEWAGGGGALGLHHGVWKVRESVFSGNSVAAGGCRGGAIYAFGGDHEVRGCLIVSNFFTLSLPVNQTGNALYFNRHSHVMNSTRLRLESSTISTNYSTGGSALQAGGDLPVYNTIVYGNSPADVTELPSSFFWHSCATSLTPGVQGNISANPLFVGGGGFTLPKTGSPCINAGISRAWMDGAVDILGNRRIMGAAVDMGAYEMRALLGSVIVIR